jgi:hypothetical protein
MEVVMLLRGGGLAAPRGIVHLFPTGSVVRGFGPLSEDNRRIITMEWIGEGVTLILIGGFVGAVTLLDPEHRISLTVYAISAGGLLVFAVVSLFTGFRVAFLPFKLCPVIFGLSAALILAGAFM